VSDDLKTVNRPGSAGMTGRTSDEAVANASCLSKPARIAWMEIFETGVGELDAWHRTLIRDCNELLGAVESDAPWIGVVAKTERLVRSCIDHFRFEEVLMERSGFPRLAAHVEEHRRIEDRLRTLSAMIQAADGSSPADRAIPGQFQEIFIDLMVRHDLDYRSHLLHCLGR
jgi:hemerythrin-like metal-binding protein